MVAVDRDVLGKTLQSEWKQLGRGASQFQDSEIDGEQLMQYFGLLHSEHHSPSVVLVVDCECCWK
jgi:hypothetical protein